MEINFALEPILTATPAKISLTDSEPQAGHGAGKRA
jgi:hypothetical protein